MRLFAIYRLILKQQVLINEWDEFVKYSAGENHFLN